LDRILVKKGHQKVAESVKNPVVKTDRDFTTFLTFQFHHFFGSISASLFDPK